MGYSNVVKKIDKLEAKGLINPINTEYEENAKKFGYMYRHSSDLDDETVDYLKEKLIEFFKKEEVIFSIWKSSDLCIEVIPHKEIENAINNSTSYSEMRKKLTDIPFISVGKHFHPKKGLSIVNSGNLDCHYTQPIHNFERMLKYIVSDDIKYDIFRHSMGHNSYYIKSEKCEDVERNKKFIDGLF